MTPQKPKLKEALAVNTPVVVRLLYKGKQFPDKYNPGKFNYQYSFELGGVEYVHFAKEYEEEQLSLYNEGEELQIVLKQDPGDEYPTTIWTPIAGAEARAAAIPTVGNSAARTASKKQASYDQEKLIYDYKLGIAGMLQAYRASGNLGNEAREMAVEDALWVREKAAELAEQSS